MLSSVEAVLFSNEKFDHCFNFSALDKTVEEACRIAAHHPKTFYLFMQRYTQFNGAAGSLVARLASSIGLSKELFKDANCEVDDEADRGLEVAAKVLFATIDEHSDQHHQGFAHRTLAQATLKSIGNYAHLNAQERNDLANIPNWLTPLLNASVNAYQGIPGNIEELVKAMGVHAASESLADREYRLIDKVVRHEKSGTGFDQYLRSIHGKVEFNSQQISAWYWVAAHGSYKELGLEKEHSEAAIEALNLATQFASVPQEKMRQWVFEGFSSFVTIQQSFFKEVQQECLGLIKNQLGTVIAQ